MQYRTDPRSGNRISALGFGCMRFPGALGVVDMTATEKLVVQAVEAGINYFDTAYIYPGSEEALGTILQRTGLRDAVFIADKLPHGKCKKASAFDALFDEQLARLKTNRIDYYLIHNVTSLAEWQRVVDLGIQDWIARKKGEGAIGQIGFSFHGSQPEFAKLLDAYDWDFCQIQYNYAGENFQAGRTGLELAAQRGLAVFIMEPLLGGRLAANLPKEAQALFKAADPGASFAQWALRWLWDQPAVTMVLSGMNAPDQVADNLATAEAALPGCLDAREHETISKVKGIFERAFRVPCTGCNYCMPCPVGINIPASFSAYNNSYLMGWFSGVKSHVLSAGGANGNPHFLNSCVHCGACAACCPQHIDIPRELDNARKRIEPSFVPPVMKVARKVLNRDA